MRFLACKFYIYNPCITNHFAAPSKFLFLSINTSIFRIISIPMANTCSSSSAASCSASTSYSGYQVFINHYGEDVKKGFASHLYRCLRDRGGFRVFLDKPELEEGDEIFSQIKDAIREASVHIAIFSENYAKSRWCLDELVLMKEARATILPVFFNVEPSMVRHTDKEGKYAEHLRVLQKETTHDPITGEEKLRYEASTIQSWRDALYDVANRKGLELKAFNSDEGELVDKLLVKVLKKVPKTELDVAKYPTGLGKKFEEFEEMLSQHHDEPEKTNVVGIVGFGGVGKTTLAKEIYNRKKSCYSKVSFLSDVREKAATRSLTSVQSQLIKDLQDTAIEIANTAQGIGKLKQHLSFCHALIIVDDVDKQDQLDVILPIKDILKPRSLIVVTSRHKDVLRSSGVSSIYNLEGLNTLHSKQLFCLYAFFQPFVPRKFAEFEVVVDQFVNACDGLPLSLKVFGALVCGQNDKGYWEGRLDRLRTTLHEDILGVLRISYDSLEEDDQSIFLDVVYYFIGEHRDMVINILGPVGLTNLENKCLLQVDHENKVKMHDHMRDLGRKIAEKESTPRRHWLFSINTIDNWLKKSSVLTDIRGIKTTDLEMSQVKFTEWLIRRNSSETESRDKELSYFRDAVQNFNLQYVVAEHHYLTRILERMQPPNLKWLRWYKCPYPSLPHWIPMENLKVLEVAGHKLKVLWSRHCQVPVELRELNILAPLSGFPKSIGQLEHLSKIVLFNPRCYSITLETLPEEFCDLRSLKHLELHGCQRLLSLPVSFGKLTRLEHIDFRGASSLSALPDSFGQLSRLKYLNLDRCSKLTIFKGTLRNITTLEFLKLTDCNQQLLGELYLKRMDMEELPGGMLHHCNLKLLLGRESLPGEDLLKELPLQIGDIKNLNDLSVSCSLKLTRLPKSFVSLTRLRRLYLYRCGIEYLPQDFALMKSLETLSVKCCPLRELPFKKVEGEAGSSTDQKCCMFGLKDLKLIDTHMSEVSFSMGVCPNLEKLKLSGYRTQIRELCGLVKLQSLNIKSCGSVTELQSFETLISLQHLRLVNCLELESIEGLEHVMSLKSVYVGGCPKLKWGRGVAEQLQQRLHQNFKISQWSNFEDGSRLQGDFSDEISDEITGAF